MLPEDGPSGPKHAGAEKWTLKHLNTNCSILCFNKQCVCWKRKVSYKCSSSGRFVYAVLWYFFHASIQAVW
jgi:hypothetical protein